MNESKIKEVVRGIVRESFKQSISEARRGIPKLFLKIEAVKKEIDRLTAERKSKFGGEYAKKLNAETDQKKREQLKQPILAISQKISKLQANLASMYEKEEEYIQNLDKDVELELSEMSVNDVHFKNILRVYDHGGSFTKKKVATAVCKNPNASRNKIIDYLKDMDYEEILQVEDELRIGESVEGDRIQKLNDRIRVLRAKISAQKDAVKRNELQQTLKNALQSLSNVRKNHGIKTESVVAKDGKVLSNNNLIGYYEFDRDADSFWVDDVKKGKGQLSFDTKKEVEDYFKKNEKDALKHLGKLRESINEAKFPIYHNSYTSAIDSALDWANKSGFDYDKEETAQKIGLGPKKPSDGKTNRFSIELSKGGKEQRKQLHIQVYGMGNGKYELNAYIG
jgi:hypothetical protein